jgi:succinate dehydrogenase flavin-adding protein (antitoxin of CptAB toxin-antitoxin module)
VSDTTKINLLALAAKRLGHEELARRMEVSDSLLLAWLGGHAAMPDAKLLALADMLEKLGDEPEK